MIYRDYRVDSYKNALEKIKEGIPFQNIDMPNNEMLEFLDVAEENYFNDMNPLNKYIYASCLFAANPDERNYDKAKNLFIEAADENCVLAMYELFIFYTYGAYNFEEDSKKGFSYLQKAMKLDYPLAYYEMADIYFFGKEVEQDLNQAYYCLNKAANDGVVPAICELGLTYETGEFGVKDLEKAEYYYKLACNYNSLQAMCYLGKFYGNEANGKTDYNKSLYYLERAYEKNYSPAGIPLALLYITGNSEIRDTNEGIKILKSLADEPDEIGENACLLLGNLYSSAEYLDYKKAINYYEQSGNGTALNNIGELYLHGNLGSVNIKKAIKHFKRAAEKENTDALVNLGNCYFEGNGVKKDLNESFNFYMTAYFLEGPKSFYYVGRAYEFGYGVEINIEKAIYAYRKSAEVDDPKGLYRYGLILLKNEKTEKEGSQMIYRAVEEYSYPPAMNDLGRFNIATGNIQKALEYFNKSASLGDSEAFFELGRLYSTNKYLPQDLKKTCFYLERGEKLKNTFCAYYLGLFYENGIYFEKDHRKAMTYFKKITGIEDNTNNIYQISKKFEYGADIDKPDFDKAEELLKVLVSKDKRYYVDYANFVLNKTRRKDHLEVAFNYYLKALINNDKYAYYGMLNFYESYFYEFMHFSLKDDEFKKLLYENIQKGVPEANLLGGAVLAFNKEFYSDLDYEELLLYAANNKCSDAYYWLALSYDGENFINYLNLGMNSDHSSIKCFCTLADINRKKLDEEKDFLLKLSSRNSSSAAILLLKKYYDELGKDLTLCISYLIKNADNTKSFAYVYLALFDQGYYISAKFYADRFLRNIESANDKEVQIAHHFFCIKEIIEAKKAGAKKWYKKHLKFLLSCDLNEIEQFKKVVAYIELIQMFFGNKNIETTFFPEQLVNSLYLVRDNRKEIDLSKYELDDESKNFVENLQKFYIEKIKVKEKE